MRTRRNPKDPPGELLCLFDLKQQLLNTSKGCVKGSICDRQHFDRKQLGKRDYFWTAERLSIAVLKTKPGKVFSVDEKAKLELAIKGLA